MDSHNKLSMKNELVGRLDVNHQNLDEEKIQQLLAAQDIEFGGKWKPKHCKPRHHVAILIPYRDRQEHLQKFLLNMHPILARQELSYGIYLIEPIGDIKFNRGLLLNIGFNESNNDGNNSWECHVYHDLRILSFLI